MIAQFIERPPAALRRKHPDAVDEWRPPRSSSGSVLWCEIDRQTLRLVRRLPFLLERHHRPSTRMIAIRSFT